MREHFSFTEPIPVSELRLDAKNYRTGPVNSQQDCIAMMLKEFGKKIINLAEHIAKHGLGIQPIVVYEEDGQWIVSDGNRRITALKLLNNPSEAPEQYRKQFKELRDNCSLGTGIPDSIVCQTADKDFILSHMKLTHLGEQDGIGHVKWGAREKQNMQADLGENKTTSLAREICNYLTNKGVNEAAQVPITNIQRLVQDSGIQKRVGISWDGERMSFNADEEEIFVILKEIILDFAVRGKKVGAIYSQKDRETYLDSFFQEHDLKPPKPIDKPIKPKASGKTQAAQINTSYSRVSTRPTNDRKRVIPQGMGLRIPRTETKAYNIQVELGTKGLNVRDNPIAAGVLVRMLVELSVNRYLKSNKIDFTKDEKLHLRIAKVANSLKSESKCDKKELQDIQKISNANELLSTHTFNSLVHSDVYTLTAKEVCTLWDNLRPFLSNCWI